MFYFIIIFPICGRGGVAWLFLNAAVFAVVVTRSKTEVAVPTKSFLVTGGCAAGELEVGVDDTPRTGCNVLQ